jgi:hypothetical protein
VLLGGMTPAPRLFPAPRPAPCRSGCVPAVPGAETHHAVAGSAELDAVLTVDPHPARVTHVATPRAVADIVYAHARGVQRFAVGARTHVDDLLRYAPGAEVLVRVTADGRATGGESALHLLRRALSHGHPAGLRLRLGAQSGDVRAWNDGLRAVSRLRWSLECEGHDLSGVDLGRLPADADLVRAVGRAVDLHLGPVLPRVLVESALSHRWRPRGNRVPASR